jgi:hypothetical protein
MEFLKRPYFYTFINISVGYVVKFWMLYFMKMVIWDFATGPQMSETFSFPSPAQPGKKLFVPYRISRSTLFYRKTITNS